MGGATYKYDGVGNRTHQNTTRYLLALQPGLSVVLNDSAGNKYVHGPRGIHAQKDAANNLTQEARRMPELRHQNGSRPHYMAQRIKAKLIVRKL
jgi:hypothetical protein